VSLTKVRGMPPEVVKALLALGTIVFGVVMVIGAVALLGLIGLPLAAVGFGLLVHRVYPVVEARLTSVLARSDS